MLLLLLMLAMLLSPPVGSRRLDGEPELKRADRVVGGADVPGGSVDWVASLQYKSSNMHFCGATVISDYWLLTAAHCMINTEKNSFQIVTGDTNLDAAGLTVRLPAKVVIADYDDTEKYNDLALIKTTTPLVPSTRTTGALLRLAASRPSEATACMVLGWGTTRSGGSTTRRLQMAPVQVQSAEDCQKAYSGQGYRIYSSMLCAGGGDQDACQGDSGGPLVCRADGSDTSADRVDSARELVLSGAVSWGVRCATHGLPGVYADVADMLHWVQHTLQTE